MEYSDILNKVKRIHMVGIGGSGMCAIAEILHARGFALTGSDVNESDNVARMRTLGIPVAMKQCAENVGDTDLVAYTAAVSHTNPELLEAQARKIPLIERAELLGLITHRYGNTVGVAGTHGKTTTTSMISQILVMGGQDPTLFIGGKLPLIDANGRAGSSDTMICEACEFRDHFLELYPAVSLILNVDADHLDYFGSLDNIIRSFHRFAEKAAKTILVNADDPNSMKAVEGITDKEIITFGTGEACTWQARNAAAGSGSFAVYDLYHNGEFYQRIQLGVPGEHNILNSTAAAAAASLCGATPQQVADGLESFKGAGRRFEFLGSHAGITVADDYAHHPTEISATINAAKAMGFQQVWAVFQPFTFSRTERHLDGFISSLSISDQVVVSDIMGSREENTTGISSRQITDRIPGAVYLPTFEEIADYVSSNAAEGDLVLTMGGGDIYKCARMIVERLKRREN